MQLIVYQRIWGVTGESAGRRIDLVQRGELFAEELNNRKETLDYFFIFEKTEK